MNRLFQSYRITVVFATILPVLVCFSSVSDSAEADHANKPDSKKEQKNSKPDAAPAFRADRILVKPKKGASKDQIRAIHGQLGAEARRTFATVGDLQVVDLPPGITVQEAKHHYEASGSVEYAEPDFIVHADAVPNDPKYLDGTLWSLNNTGQSGGVADADIDAPEGWDVLRSATGVIVAVIDTGVRYSHEDLAANIWTNPGEIAGNAIDDDGNGYIDDVHGWNALANNGNPLDDHGHGTHVAGTIGAVGNNGIGVAGVAWQMRIMACKFLGASGGGSTSDAIECMDYARVNGATVMNNSWGGGGFSQALLDAIEVARDAGIIFVASAGNNGANTDSTPQYPAGYDVENVVAVAATDRNDLLAGFSNYGQESVELGAPGVDIYSTHGSGDSAYQTLSGTSMSAPHVSGAMALLSERFPSANFVEIIERALAATDPVPSLASKTITGGRLNLGTAVEQDPIPYFVATPQRGPVPLAVSFLDRSVGNVTSRSWNFGNGSPTSSAVSPTMTYTSAGAYQATLTVTGPGGTHSRARSITAFVPIVYQITLTNFSWINPSGMTALTLSDDSFSAAQMLPFPFVFYGQTYTSLYVGSNGLLAFDPSGLARFQNADLPDLGSPNALICPYWDDLNPAVAGSVRIGTVGAAPNRMVVVSWVGVPLFADGASPTAFYTFQALLYEGSNAIVFQYQQVRPGGAADGGVSATLGIENETGEIAAKYSFQGSALVNNDQALRFVAQLSAPGGGTGSLSVSPATGLAASGEWAGTLTPNSQSYTLRNTGNGSISWLAGKNQNWVNLSATGGTLIPGASTTVTVSLNNSARFLPVGTHTDTVRFSTVPSGNGDTTRSVTVTLTSPPVINISPSSQAYGSIAVGSSLDRVFTVLNFGGGVLTGNATVPLPFVIVSGGSYSLTAGSSSPLTVRFAPGAAGSSSNLVTFTGGGNVTAPVSGTGTGGGNGGAISVSPASRHFGTVAVGAGLTKQFTITNTGSGTVAGAAFVAAPFTVVSNATYSISAGASKTVTVRFAPTADGTVTNAITFTGGGGKTATVIGTGLVVPQAPTNLTAIATGGDVRLQWNDNSTKENGFRIERRDKMGTNWTSYAQIATVGPNPTSTGTFLDTTPNSGPHRYRIRAFRDSLSSAYSNAAWVQTN